MMIIKFGKHKGKDISELPQDYLFWLVENTDVNDAKYGRKNQELVDACNNEINRRSDRKTDKPIGKPAAISSDVLSQILAELKAIRSFLEIKKEETPI